MRGGVEEEEDEGVDGRVGNNCHPNYSLKIQIQIQEKVRNIKS